jgi:hypothetical protein
MKQALKYIVEYLAKEELQTLTIRLVTPIGRGFRLIEDYATRRFWILKQSNKAKAINNMILELRHRDKT